MVAQWQMVIIHLRLWQQMQTEVVLQQAYINMELSMESSLTAAEQSYSSMVQNIVSLKLRKSQIQVHQGVANNG